MRARTLGSTLGEGERRIDRPPERDRPSGLWCGRCSRGCDDLLLCEVNGKDQRLCPGCAADRRIRGDRVVVRGVL